MANLEYTVRGNSPKNGKLNYKLDNDMLVSIRPVNLKLTVKMDPDYKKPIDGEVILKISRLSKGFYNFESGLKEIVKPFKGVKDDFNEEINTSVILLTSDVNNAFPLKVYLQVKAKNGDIYPEDASIGKFEWKIGDVTMPIELLMKKLSAKNINLNVLLK